MRTLSVVATLVVGVSALAAVTPASALSMADCSAKYKAAQAANKLNGQSWNDFRKAQCGTDATAATPTTGAASGTATAGTTTTAKSTDKPAAVEPTPETTENAPEPPPSTAVAPKGVTFPKAVSPKYASETPGKARMHTCLDQYNVNKSANTLSGLTWIAKGGGYYSICNTKLKG